MNLSLPFLFSSKVSHFVAVYEQRNLRVAAESAGISQPALTKSLKLLEEQLGVTLFIRSAKGMQPTAAADILFHHIKNIADLTRSAEVELSTLRGVGEGLIRIGAGQMWNRLFIADIAAAFRQKYPAINLEISTGPMLELVEELSEGSLDIVVGDFDGITVSSKFSKLEIWSPDFLAFAGEDHPLAQLEKVELTDLVKYAWSGYLDRNIFSQKVSTLCSLHGVKEPHISLKATSMATLLQLTRDSGNILVLPQELEDEAARSNLVPLRSNLASLWVIRTGVIIESRKPSIPQYRELLDLIKGITLEERT